MSKEKTPLYTKSRAKILKEVAAPFHQQYKSALDAKHDGAKKEYKELTSGERAAFINDYRGFLRKNTNTRFKLEKKRREKSKHGLKNYLAREDVGVISANDILPSGEFNIEKLKKTEYFQQHPEHLTGLEDFTLSTNTKMMREVKAREEKKKINQQQAETKTNAAVEYIKNNKKKTAVIGLGILAAGLGTAYYLSRKERRSQSTENKMKNAEIGTSTRGDTEADTSKAGDKEPEVTRSRDAYKINQAGVRHHDVPEKNIKINIDNFSEKGQTDSETAGSASPDRPNQTSNSEMRKRIADLESQRDQLMTEKKAEEVKLKAGLQKEIDKLKQEKESLEYALKTEKSKHTEQVDASEAEALRLKNENSQLKGENSAMNLALDAERKEKKFKETEAQLALEKRAKQLEDERKKKLELEASNTLLLKQADEQRSKSQEEIDKARKSIIDQAGVIESLQQAQATLARWNSALADEKSTVIDERGVLKSQIDQNKKSSKRRTSAAFAAGGVVGLAAGAALMALADDDPRYVVSKPDVVKSGLDGKDVKISGGKLIIEGIDPQPAMILDDSGNIIFSGDKTKYPDLMKQFEAAGYKISTSRNPAFPKLDAQEGPNTDTKPEFVESTPSGAKWVHEKDGTWTLLASPIEEGQVGNVLITGAGRALSGKVDIGYSADDLIDVAKINKQLERPVRNMLDGYVTPGLDKIIRPLDNGTPEPDYNELDLKVYPDNKGIDEHTKVTFSFEPQWEVSTRWAGNTEYRYKPHRYIENGKLGFDFRFVDPETGHDKHVLVKAHGHRLTLDTNSAEPLEIYTPDGVKKMPNKDFAKLVFDNRQDRAKEGEYTRQFNPGISAVLLENDAGGVIKSVNAAASLPGGHGMIPDKKYTTTFQTIAITPDPEQVLNIISPETKVHKVNP